MKGTRRIRRAARQLFRACLVDGVLDEARARLVAGRLGTSRKRGALAILSGFQRLVRLDRDRHTAIVESAAPLADAVRQRLQGGLTRTYGADLETAFIQNAELIGGLRIKVGSEVFDDSIRARLAALEARL